MMATYLTSMQAKFQRFARFFAPPPALPRVPQIAAALLLAAIFLGAGVGVPSDLKAADDKHVDADQAFRSIGNQTWYDRDSDGYAPPDVIESVDNSIRTKGWIAEKVNAKKKQQAINSGGNPSGGWWNWRFPSVDPSLFSTIVISLLAVALVAVIMLLSYHSLRHYLPGRWAKKDKKKAMDIDPAKVSELPFDVQPARQANPLAEAEALMRASNYNLAIVYLYGYMLLVLDQSRRIELQRGKTNRMYLRELKRQLELHRIVEATMLAFEEVYFGKHPLSRDQFLGSWNQLDRFHALVSAQPSGVSQPPVAEVAAT